MTRWPLVLPPFIPRAVGEEESPGKKGLRQIGSSNLALPAAATAWFQSMVGGIEKKDLLRRPGRAQRDLRFAGSSALACSAWRWPTQVLFPALSDQRPPVRIKSSASGLIGRSAQLLLEKGYQ
jgi:hypothetical protein